MNLLSHGNAFHLHDTSGGVGHIGLVNTQADIAAFMLFGMIAVGIIGLCLAGLWQGGAALIDKARKARRKARRRRGYVPSRMLRRRYAHRSR